MSEQSQSSGSDERLGREPEGHFGWAVSTLSTDRSWATVLWLVGEVDLFTLSALRAALTDGLDRADGRLLVDVSRLTFCSVAGFGLLERTESTAAENGIDYAIRGCSPSLARLRSLLRQVDQVRHDHVRPRSSERTAADGEPPTVPQPQPPDRRELRIVRASPG